jgi:hypothetical protein
MVIFDGTSKSGEIFSIIFRWCDANLEIKERLLEMGMYQHGFNHQELISVIMRVLGKYKIDLGSACRGRKIRNGKIAGFQRDRASNNSTAVDILVLNCIGAKDFECLSHTGMHPGDKLAANNLKMLKQDLCPFMLSVCVIIIND